MLSDQLYNMNINDMIVKKSSNAAVTVIWHRVIGGWNLIYKIYTKLEEGNININTTSQFVPMDNEFMPKEEEIEDIKNLENGEEKPTIKIETAKKIVTTGPDVQEKSGKESDKTTGKKATTTKSD